MYRALYRKWRPSTFDDVYGQPHVTRTLKNELSTGRISHAYLFTGSRGTGKTSCAKILSKAVNCLNSVDGNPCNECEACRGIDSDSITDVVEIDAASNNGVDNIRDLREEANFTPAFTKYRVYIIDEVHMLSTGAFNALLKTLEEPPAHVIFILATTEIHKLPATILSRCQRFDFKRIAPEEIVRRLQVVAEGESVTITEEAATLIANIADGGMRDALSIMDRCLSDSDSIDENTVCNVAGIAGTQKMFEFSDYIAKKDFSSSLKLVDELNRDYCDIDRICVRIAEHFRNLMVAYSVTNCDGLIVCSGSELQKYKEEAKKFRLSKIIECIEIISKTSALLKSASNKKIQLESAVIKMCSSEANGISPDLEARIDELEKKINVISSGNIVSSPVKEEPAKEKIYNPFLDEAMNFGKPSVKKEEPKPEPEPEIKEEPKTNPFLNDLPDSEPPKKPKLPEAIKDEAPDERAELNIPSLNSPPVSNDLPDGAFGEWPEVLEALYKFDQPLYGVMGDTTASISGGKVIIKTSNPSLADFIKSDNRVHYVELMRSIFTVTGKKPKLVVNCVNSKTEEKRDYNPLESVINKINKFNQGE